MSSFNELVKQIPRYDEWPTTPQCCATCYNWSGGLCCRHSKYVEQIHTPRNGWRADWKDER